MYRKILTINILLGLSILLYGCGVTTYSLKNNPGYASMVYPNSGEANKKLSLSLGPWTLKTVLRIAETNDTENTELYQALKDIEGIRITIYDNIGNDSLIQDAIAKSLKKLSHDGWSKIVSVNDKAHKGERVIIMAKSNKEVIDGLSLMTSDGEEAVFINIIGRIDAETINLVSKKFHKL